MSDAEQLGKLIVQKVDELATEVAKLRDELSHIKVELARKDGLAERVDKLAARADRHEIEVSALKLTVARWSGIAVTLATAASAISKYLLP